MSNNDQHIRDSIKDSFAGQERKAPANLWDGISAASSLTDDELKIRDSFNVIDKKAPTDSWQTIKKNVIIDEVWDRILLKEKKKKRAIWFWSFGLGVLLIGILINQLNNEGENLTSTSIEISDTEVHGEKIEENSSKDESNNQTNKQNTIVEADIIKSTDQVNELVNNGINLLSEEVFTEIEAGENMESNEDEVMDSNISTKLNLNREGMYGKENLDKIDSTQERNDIVDAEIDKFDFNRQEDISTMPIAQVSNLPATYGPFSMLHEIERKETENTQHFELGLIAGINNTWLFNNDVKNGLDSKSLIKNDLSIGYNFGIIANYNINLRSTISLEYDFISELNQGYEYFHKGRLYTRDLKLNHQKIELSYKLNFTHSILDKNYFVLKAGGFYSFLQRSQSSGLITSSNDNFIFSENDLGLKLAFGHEHRLNHFKIEYGLQSDIGLLNISTDSPNSPKKFNYTSSYLIGCYASIRYLF